eukprot:Stramenopile-MAST_4_protein_3835
MPVQSWLSNSDEAGSCHFTLRDVSAAHIWGHGIEFLDTLSSVGKIRVYRAERLTPSPAEPPRWEEYMSTGKYHMEFIVGGNDDSNDLQMLLRPDNQYTGDLILPAAFNGDFDQSSDASEIQFLRSRGTKDSPLATEQNDVLGYITFKSYANADWLAAAQIYGVLEQDLDGPGAGMSGGKIVFATAEKNTKSTHELVDRMTIDGEGNIFQRSTTRTGIGKLVHANNVTTGTGFFVQTAGLTTGTGMEVSTEIEYVPPEAIDTFRKDGTLLTTPRVVAKFFTGDRVNITNCTAANNGYYIVRSSHGSRIQLQTMDGYAPRNLAQLTSAGVLTVPDTSFVSLLKVNDRVVLGSCTTPSNDGSYLVHFANSSTVKLKTLHGDVAEGFASEVNSCKIWRPGGTLVKLEATTQQHGTVLDIDASSMVDGEAVRITANSLAGNGKALHVISTSKLAENVVRIDAGVTNGTVMALNANGLTQGTLFKLTSTGTTLGPSPLSHKIVAITQTTPAIVTCDAPHNFADGDKIRILGIGSDSMDTLNMNTYSIQVIPQEPTKFELWTDTNLSPINTTGETEYLMQTTTGGQVHRITGTLVSISANYQTTGTMVDIDSPRLIDGTALKISSGSNMQTGKLLDLVTTSTNLVHGALHINADSMEQGRVVKISSDGITTGTILDIETTSPNVDAATELVHLHATNATAGTMVDLDEQ